MSKRFCIRAAAAVGGVLLLACASPVLSTPSAPQEGVPLVIDHTTADLAQIPGEWLVQARLLSLQLAHTSHGSQLVTGAAWWESVRPELDVDIRSVVTPPGPEGALNIYDGNAYDEDNYITPEMYWSTDDGRAHTEQVAATGLFGYSMWSWCGQQSENSEEQVNDYLATLAQFEANHPGMRFIYMTGHTDGGSETMRWRTAGCCSTLPIWSSTTRRAAITRGRTTAVSGVRSGAATIRRIVRVCRRRLTGVRTRIRCFVVRRGRHSGG